jgi:hypothetical protein
MFGRIIVIVYRCNLYYGDMRSLAVLICCVVYGVTFSQACGEGGYGITVYYGAPSGDTIWYELFPVRESSLNSLYPEANVYAESQAIQVSTKYAQGLLGDSTDRNEFLEISNRLGNNTTGLEHVLKGHCAFGFKTYELNSTPYLLRLHDGTKEIYIVSSFMGGCNSHIEVGWPDGSVLR